MASTPEKPQTQDAEMQEEQDVGTQDTQMQDEEQDEKNGLEEQQEEENEEETPLENEESVGTPEEEQDTEQEQDKSVEEEQEEEKALQEKEKSITETAEEEEQEEEKETLQEQEKSITETAEVEQGEEEQMKETLQEQETSAVQKTPTQATSATKRKFDALHARNLASPSISEHEKNKKARASALMKSPAMRAETKPARKVTKAREFSFARPTASSARRTVATATAAAHVRAKVTTPRKPQTNKYTPAKAQRASMPAPKTPAMDKPLRAHFNYTPYSGPLPPLTVESSFAPKGYERGARTASPAKMKPSAKKVPSHSTAGKENAGVNTNGGAATNAASSSKTHRTPVKSHIASPVTKDKNRSAFKDKVKGQRSVAQQDARSSPVSTTAILEPME